MARLSSILSVLVLGATGSSSCGDNRPPAVFFGESTHFRLWIDPALSAGTLVPRARALQALETNWTDTRTMLAMPDGEPDRKIDYYWLTEAHIPGACEADRTVVVGCAQGLSVYAPNLPDQHELNHAYMYLRDGHHPVSLLTEGLAEAIRCGNATTAQPAASAAPWRQSLEGDNAYAQGKQLVRHLILERGIEPFLRYYSQAPAAADADIFAANFAAFWSVSLDEIWSDMQATGPGLLKDVNPICPCSLPPFPTDGREIVDQGAEHPYWTLPPMAGDSMVLESTRLAAPFTVFDCTSQVSKFYQWGPMLARLSSLHFVAGFQMSAARGTFIAESCASAETYDVPASVTHGVGGHVPGAQSLQIVASRVHTRDLVPVFLRLHVSGPVYLTGGRSVAVCNDCGFDSTDCAEHRGGEAVPVEGTFYVRTTLGGPIDQTLSATEMLSFAPR